MVFFIRVDPRPLNQFEDQFENMLRAVTPLPVENLPYRVHVHFYLPRFGKDKNIEVDLTSLSEYNNTRSNIIKEYKIIPTSTYTLLGTSKQTNKC